MKLFTLDALQATVRTRVAGKCLSSILMMVLFPVCVFAQQAITGIVTDYNSYWKTSTTSVNPIKPTNSHNLLAFTYNGKQYSTGVNDAALLSRNETFVAGDFWSLPVDSYSGTITSNTKVGVGEMYDGVHNGASNPAPENSIKRYLTDGIKGLNIGTCIANLPVGTLIFNVSNINKNNIGDGIPDIIVTQVADPSGSFDRYSFMDANGNTIGSTRDVVFSTITPVANWTADFYNANTTPMVLESGFTNTDRPMRLWAADLSDFGITQANYQSIRKFKINLSGSSDVAFAAYNNKTFSVSLVLPVTLTAFSATKENNSAKLSWETATEINSGSFVVEKSTDNSNFVAIATVKAAGNSTETRKYTTTDNQLQAGVNYYRLKMIDMDGRVEYSQIVQVTGDSKKISLSIFPNPATNKIVVNHPSSANSFISIYNAQGSLVKQISAVRTLQTTIHLDGMTKGVYYLDWQNGQEKSNSPFVIK